MNKMHFHQDVYIGIICLAFCFLVFMLNANLPVDAAMTPRILCVMLVILSALIIQQGWRKSKMTSESHDKKLTWDSLKIPMITWGLVLIYVLLFMLVGYFVSTAIMLVVLMRFMRRTAWHVILMIDGFYLLIMYFVFVKMFDVNIAHLGLLGQLI